MLNSETAQFVRLLDGRIESVNPDGSTNVQTLDGARINNVRALLSFGQSTPRPGADCLILSDGAKFYLIGLLQPRPSGQQDRVQAGDSPAPKDTLDPGLKEISDVNALGLGARILVGAGVGVSVDAGGICATTWNGALGQITHYVERMEVCAVGHRSQLMHNGELCEARYSWRSVVDNDAIQRDLTYDQDSAKNKGNTLDIDIHPRGEASAVRVRITNQGQEVMSMSFDKDGSWSWDAAGKLSAQMGSAGLSVNVESQVTIESQQKVVIKAANVYIGDEPGALPLALAPTSNANNNAIKTVLESHQHSYILPLIPGPVVITTPSAIPGTNQLPVVISDESATRAKGL